MSADMSEETNKTAEIFKNFLFNYHKTNEDKLSEILETVDKNFKYLNERLNSIEEKLNSLTKDTSKNFKKVDGNFQKVDGQLVSLKEILDHTTSYEGMLENMRLIPGGKQTGT